MHCNNQPVPVSWSQAQAATILQLGLFYFSSSAIARAATSGEGDDLWKYLGNL